MDAFQGIGPNGKQFPVETASHFYATNYLMLSDTLHIEWTGGITIVSRDTLGAEHPENSITASGSNQVWRAFQNNFQYAPPFTDTETLELRADFEIQNAETKYGPQGPGPVNCTDFQTDYIAAFQAQGNTFQQKQDFVLKWLGQAEQVQQPLTAAQAVAILAAAGYTSTPSTPTVTNFTLAGPVQNLGSQFGNALKGLVSIQGAVPISIAIRPGPPARAYDDSAQDITDSITSQGVDVQQIFLEMQKALGG